MYKILAGFFLVPVLSKPTGFNMNLSPRSVISFIIKRVRTDPLQTVQMVINIATFLDNLVKEIWSLSAQSNCSKTFKTLSISQVSAYLGVSGFLFWMPLSALIITSD